MKFLKLLEMILSPKCLAYVLFITSLTNVAVAVKRGPRRRSFKINPYFEENVYDLQRIIEKNMILSDLDGFFYAFKPVGSLIINYEYHDDIPVKLGNYLSPLDTFDVPKITFLSFFPLDKLFINDLYTIVLTDLDPEYQKCHAIWGNLKINMEDVTIVNFAEGKEEKLSKPGYKYLKEGIFKNSIGLKSNIFKVNFDLEDGSEIMSYAGPGPKEGTGIHRYVFILFRQTEGKIPLESRLEFRERWGSENNNDHGVGDWATYYRLQPLAYNFFRSSNEGLF